VLLAETPHWSEFPLREVPAWYPFSPVQFCQPMVRADEDRHALIATAVYLRGERSKVIRTYKRKYWLAAEAELYRHFAHRFT
jgi:hypothetical protein